MVKTLGKNGFLLQMIAKCEKKEKYYGGHEMWILVYNAIDWFCHLVVKSVQRK